jgi:fructose-1,6-bisphosphatase I
MCEVARANPQLQDLETLMSSIQTACKTIGSLVARAHITGMVGYEVSGSINVQGEEQKKLDVITNDVLKKALRFTGKMGVIASEEEEAPFEVDEENGGVATYHFKPILDETSK